MALRSLRRSDHEQHPEERMETASLPTSEIACADDTDERLQKKNWLAGIISRYLRNGICRSVGTLLRHGRFLRSGSTLKLSNAPWTLCGGSDSELGQRSKDCPQDHQREGGVRRHRAVLSPSFKKWRRCSNLLKFI